MSYVENNPVQHVMTDHDGTEISEVTKLGKHHYIGRQPAFVGLAKQTGGWYAENTEGMTLDKALEAADLTFTMEFAPITSQVITPHGVSTVEYPAQRGAVAVWPDGRTRGMGTVGDRYKFIQPRTHGELSQAILQEGGANVVAVGSYGNPLGVRNYMALKLPQDLVVGGTDTFDLYLTTLNSHGGNGSLTGLFAPIRRECTNQTTATFGPRIKNRFRFQHSGDMDNKLADARKALGIVEKWSHAWKAEGERLLKIKMSDAELEQFIATLLPTPAAISTASGEGNWAARRLACKQVITSSETNQFGTGTAYAAFNGLTEWVDFAMPVRDGKHIPAEQRMYTRLLDGGEGEKLKIEAARLLRATH